MIEERMSYCDRMVTRLRKEQEELLTEWEELEEIIKSYERESNHLYRLLNDTIDNNYGGTDNDDD